MPAPVLQLDKATIRFGGLTAVNAVDFIVNEGELVGLIGPNGAGKTTVFNLITGVYPATDGTVTFRGRNLAGLRVNEIVELGIARTFQNIRLFGSLSVFDNVRVACNLHRGTHPAQSLVRLKAFRDDEAAVAKRVEELLDIFNLRRFRDAPAKSLPYGEQRRLEIVRCLATQPKLLLLDEPAAGMNPTEKVYLVSLIQQIQQQFRLHQSAAIRMRRHFARRVGEAYQQAAMHGVEHRGTGPVRGPIGHQSISAGAQVDPFHGAIARDADRSVPVRAEPAHASHLDVREDQSGLGPSPGGEQPCKRHS